MPRIEEQTHAVAEVSNFGIHLFSDKSILMIFNDGMGVKTDINKNTALSSRLAKVHGWRGDASPHLYSSCGGLVSYVLRVV